MNLTEPLVSVIMPAYNAESFIKKAIDSVLSSTYQNIELLIADDASTDNTINIINQFSDSRIKLFKNSTNYGYLKTWNYLMEKAKGAFICFCDADDYISKEKIEKQAVYLMEHGNIGICGSNISIVNENNEVIKSKIYPCNWLEIQGNLFTEFQFPFAGSAVMIKAEVYEVTGGYRNFFDRLGWEDHDWLIRCCENFKGTNLSEIHYFYRKNVNSVTQSYSEDDRYKLHSKKIGIQIAKYKKATNIDLIDACAFWKLYSIVLEYDKKYIKKESSLYFDLARANGDKKTRLLFFKKALIVNPFKLRYYYYFIKSIFR